MDINVAIDQILLLCVVMAIGFLSRKKGYITDSIESAISTILLKIGLPAIIIASANFSFTPESIPNILQVSLLSLIYYIGAFLVSGVVAKLLKYESATYAVFILLCVLPNATFIGIPVVSALLGSEAVFYISISNVFFYLFQWTIGVIIFDTKSKINLSKLWNIGFVATLAALVIFIAQIRFPSVLQSALEKTGSMTIPLSMLLIGSNIAKMKVAQVLQQKKVFLVSALRLLIIPAIFMFGMLPFHLNAVPLAVCTLIFSMPSGTLVSIMATDFQKEPLFASIGVFGTTLFCLLTIPLMITLVSKFVLT